MNRIEKDNSKSLKREKLKNFLSERRFQKEAQAAARKETARRLTSERRARLIAERTHARQRKEFLKEARIKSRVKTRAPESAKTAAPRRRSEPEKREVFKGGKTQSVSGEEGTKPSSPAKADNRQAKNRQKILAYLAKDRAKKSEIAAGKIRQKEAAATEKKARRAERKREKQSLRQQKLTAQSQKKASAAALLARQKSEAGIRRKEEPGTETETNLAAAGHLYNRLQLLSYLKKRKAGGKTFAVQRRELKKVTEEWAPGVSPVPAVPEVIPVLIPPVTPPAPLETERGAPEKVLPPAEEKTTLPAEEKPAGRRRLKFPLAKGRKTPSETAELAAVPQAALSAQKPFRIVPFLKDYYIRIIFVLLILGWFVEIALLNRRLEIVRQQIEQTAGIAKPHVAGEGIVTARVSPLTLETTRVEGIRDPFSDKLWRIQEITPAQARAVGIRPPARIPAPPSIIQPVTPILIAKPPEFTSPEVARAIPESAKLAHIPPVTVPQVGPVSPPSAPASDIRFRGILNVAGIDYFFVESAAGGYRVRVGDTVEGFKIYDYRNGVLYFARDGYTYQLNEERVSPPLRYRGRMIMAGQEYFFLEGQRTYRAVIGEAVEGYQLVKRVGDYLYFVKDDRLYYLKQE